jgi:hypothetical protein
VHPLNALLVMLIRFGGSVMLVIPALLKMPVLMRVTVV